MEEYILANYELVFTIIIGLLACFFGYRIKKITFFILWFLLGFNLMRFFMPTINGWFPEIAGVELWQNLLPICGGLLLSLIGFTIEKICVSGLCFCLVMVIGIRYFGTDIPVLLISALVGLIAGALAVRLMKPSIIAVSAIAGAYALTNVLFSFLPQLDRVLLYLPILAGIAVIGAIFQVTTTKHVN